MTPLEKKVLFAKKLQAAQHAATTDNTLRVRLDDDHWQMLTELCQTNDRDTPDMVRKMIRDAYAQLGKGKETMTTEKTARNRVDNDPKLSAHSETIFYDWDNQDEHLEWVAIAPTEEIVDWAETVESQ